MGFDGIIRVFPRRTKATPDDALAFVGSPTKEFLSSLDRGGSDSDDGVGGHNEHDNNCNGSRGNLTQIINRREVHVSVTFTYDIPKAEKIAQDWHKAGFAVKLGGAAFNNAGGDFVPGLYLKHGYVITSRGCDKSCWHCSVPQREGGLRELPITDGWNVLDDNLLACSEGHIRSVFEMLSRQPKRPVFSGGLDSQLLLPWHVELLRQVKTERMYFAYDNDCDFEPLVQAGRLLRSGGIIDSSGHKLKCYVLIGYQGDTMVNAEKRLHDTWRAGFWPYAMLYRNEQGETNEYWRRFQRTWTRPQIVYHMLKQHLPKFLC